MPVNAATLPLVGGHVALDLVNTVEPRLPVATAQSGRDHLTDPEALLTWATRAGLADDGDAAAVRAAWEHDRGAADAALAATGEIREALYTALLAALELVPPDAPSVRTALDQLHTRRIAALGRSGLRLGADRRLQVDVGLAPALLIPDRAVEAAHEVLLGSGLDRLGRCPTEDGGCGWLFLDHSRNRSRRWCRMSDCGTTVKARRLTDRRRVTRQNTTV